MKAVTLTDHQQESFDKLWNFIESSADSNYYLFTGCAGSGKSTSIIQLICKFVDEAKFNRVAVTATTNKATKVVKDMLPAKYRDKVKFSTLHSILGLKHKITANGKEVFEKDPKERSKVSMFDLLIIDESSMISDEVFHELQNQNKTGIKVIFVGDPNQINPVNHEHSIPMIEESRKKYNIEITSLTEVVRQAKGNPIIEFSQDILYNFDNIELTPGQKNFVDGRGLAVLNKHQPEVVNSLLDHYFCSDEFDKNADYCKVLAWRNATVDKFNKVIRKMKYGNSAPKIVLQEKLIVDRPIKRGDAVIFSINDELNVKKIEIKTVKIGDDTYQYYECLVEGIERTDTIKILHESSQGMFSHKLKVMEEHAKAQTTSYQKSQNWIAYFEYKDHFDYVNYNYAVTCHCSQGSTYTNAFVVYSDITLNQNDEEMKRILYTAVTRPKENLFLL